MIPYTELEQEAFIEKYNEMIMAKTEATKTAEFDQQVICWIYIDSW